MAKFNAQEVAAINTAWKAIRELCSRTNWSDGPAWREAERLERRQASSDETQAGTWARAMICKAWADGFDNPDKAARDLYWIRPGYLAAMLLGVRHAIEQAGSDYNGARVSECRELCSAAIAANEAHSRRIVEG